MALRRPVKALQRTVRAVRTRLVTEINKTKRNTARANKDSAQGDYVHLSSLSTARKGPEMGISSEYESCIGRGGTHDGGQFAHDDLQFPAQSTVGLSMKQPKVQAGIVSDIGGCLQVGGRVEPLGDLPLGSKEGAAAQGDGSYHQNQTPHDTTYQGYLRWVAQQQGQLLQQQHQQQQSHRQQQQRGQQQQRQEVRQFQQQQWTGVAGGAPPSHLSTQQQQHPLQQQQWGCVAGGTPSSNLPTQNQQYGFTSGVQTLESAGVSASSLGIQGNFGNLFTESTHDRGMIQDADWLSRIKYLADVGKRKRSSNWLRPDHHIEMDKGHEDMSFQELWYGMNCVRDRIRRENLQV